MHHAVPAAPEFSCWVRQAEPHHGASSAFHIRADLGVHDTHGGVSVTVPASSPRCALNPSGRCDSIRKGASASSRIGAVLSAFRPLDISMLSRQASSILRLCMGVMGRCITPTLSRSIPVTTSALTTGRVQTPPSGIGWMRCTADDTAVPYRTRHIWRRRVFRGRTGSSQRHPR